MKDLPPTPKVTVLSLIPSRFAYFVVFYLAGTKVVSLVVGARPIDIVWRIGGDGL